MFPSGTVHSTSFKPLQQPAIKHMTHQWTVVTMPTTWRKKTFRCPNFWCFLFINLARVALKSSQQFDLWNPRCFHSSELPLRCSSLRPPRTPVPHICGTTQKRLSVDHPPCPSGPFLARKKTGRVLYLRRSKQERWQKKAQAVGCVVGRQTAKQRR